MRYLFRNKFTACKWLLWCSITLGLVLVATGSFSFECGHAQTSQHIGQNNPQLFQTPTGSPSFPCDCSQGNDCSTACPKRLTPGSGETIHPNHGPTSEAPYISSTLVPFASKTPSSIRALSVPLQTIPTRQLFLLHSTFLC